MNWLESQIETRMKLDSELTERAYAKLAASVTDPRHAPSVLAGDIEQADDVVKAALRYCGAQPGAVPADVTDPTERLEYLCRPSGTMHRIIELEPNWYKSAFGALVGRLDSGEPIVLLPLGFHGYYFLEPGSKRKVKVNSATAAHIQKEAVLFYKALPTRPLAIRDLLSFIFGIFDRVDYLLVVLAAAAVALVGLLPPWAYQVAFGTVAPSGQAALIAPIGALLLGVTISSTLITVCRNLVMARVETKVNIYTEAATFARLMSLPASFFKEYASGNLATRVLQVNQLTQQLAAMILNTGLTTLFSLIYVFQIAVFAPQLVLPALAVIMLQAAAAIIATIIESQYQRSAMQASAEVSGLVTALLNGISKIKLAGAEDRAFSRWANSYSEYTSMQYNRPTLVRAVTPVVALIGIVGTIVIYFMAGSTGVSVQNYYAFNIAYGQVAAAIMALTGIAVQVSQIPPMLELVKPILEAEPEVSDGKPSVGSLNGAIEVSGVSFRYNSDSPYIVKDLSFKVRPGEYVALVGKSGCGKSTIMRLLLGFETPERGTIFYGPHDASKVDLRSLRQHIGTVMQDGKLFMGDIFSNITISSPTATLDDAWEAAEIAGVADDIRKMPMGMQTVVTEGGGGVSGGQRQRLMIARAVCGKRRILMLDEATSALDNKTQRHVSDSLDALKCTRVVVAHRLSTVRHCDRILVVDGGKIAEEGTYEELIERNGIFAELVKRQRLDVEE